VTDEQKTPDEDGIDLEALKALVMYAHDRELTDHLGRIETLEDRATKLMDNSDQVKAAIPALLEAITSVVSGALVPLLEALEVPEPIRAKMALGGHDGFLAGWRHVRQQMVLADPKATPADLFPELLEGDE
jgi:hypothetical protein